MSRADVSQVDVLKAVRDRLRDALGLDPNQCYVSLTPRSPNLPRGGDWFLVVTPGDGDFHPEEQSAAQCIEYSVVTVTIYSRCGLDRTDENEQLTLEEARGLLTLKRTILKALVNYDLATDAGDTFLRDLLHAVRATAPEVVESTDTPHSLLGTLSIDFALTFDWDLTT